MFYGVQSMKDAIIDIFFMCRSTMKYTWKFIEIYFHGLWKLHDNFNHGIFIGYESSMVKIIMEFS